MLLSQARWAKCVFDNLQWCFFCKTERWFPCEGGLRVISKTAPYATLRRGALNRHQFVQPSGFCNGTRSRKQVPHRMKLQDVLGRTCAHLGSWLRLNTIYLTKKNFFGIHTRYEAGFVTLIISERERFMNDASFTNALCGNFLVLTNCGNNTLIFDEKMLNMCIP